MTSWTPDQVLPSHQLAGDLGFDSLTTLEFMAVLSRARPGTTPPPRELFNPSLTVSALAAYIGQTPAVEIRASTSTRHVIRFEPSQNPWLTEHRPGGESILPLAALIEATSAAFRTHTNGPITFSQFRALLPIRVGQGPLVINVDIKEDLSFTLQAGDSSHVSATGVASRGVSPERMLSQSAVESGAISIATFYKEFAFHGPHLQSVAETPLLGPNCVSGTLRMSSDAVVILDGALQLALYALVSQRQTSSPLSALASKNSSPSHRGQATHA